MESCKRLRMRGMIDWGLAICARVGRKEGRKLGKSEKMEKPRADCIFYTRFCQRVFTSWRPDNTRKGGRGVGLACHHKKENEGKDAEGIKTRKARRRKGVKTEDLGVLFQEISARRARVMFPLTTEKRASVEAHSLRIVGRNLLALWMLSRPFLTARLICLFGDVWLSVRLTSSRSRCWMMLESLSSMSGSCVSNALPFSAKTLKSLMLFAMLSEPRSVVESMNVDACASKCRPSGLCLLVMSTSASFSTASSTSPDCRLLANAWQADVNSEVSACAISITSRRAETSVSSCRIGIAWKRLDIFPRVRPASDDLRVAGLNCGA
eukprot:m.208030 g.208030  ORF g.208030 m.208030 type:complete len:323 (-) comp17796_c0_seq1:75-1043(-)